MVVLSSVWVRLKLVGGADVYLGSFELFYFIVVVAACGCLCFLYTHVHSSHGNPQTSLNVNKCCTNPVIVLFVVVGSGPTTTTTAAGPTGFRGNLAMRDDHGRVHR